MAVRIAAAAADNGKRLRVRVSNTAGSATSTATTLAVAGSATAPTISAQPAGLTVVAPATATFAVTAAGTPAPGYQWQISTNAGASYSNVNGATAASYTTPATTGTDNGNRYRVLVSNSAGSVTGSAATDRVGGQPASTLTAAILATCPDANSASKPNFYPCMVGTLVGTSLNTGAACTFTVGSNGVPSLQTGGATYSLGTSVSSYTKVTRTGVLLITVSSTTMLQQMQIGTGNANSTVASSFFTTGGALSVGYTDFLAGGGSSCSFVAGP